MLVEVQKCLYTLEIVGSTASYPATCWFKIDTLNYTNHWGQATRLSTRVLQTGHDPSVDNQGLMH
jgi:hypothetical protein